ncbi:Sorbin and SH3 domain-containing protein 1 [Liparis tanakae]|uniref:Sorbin and SH3 domain-containing protein 1 n=1 Tax=Liparis tanakae TaxID=230148 RepID=A0A4Z2EUK6_9TELE|nr:Sorbin and SH3 domain-containing protein 1 [Liparis tanakae]
MKPLSAAKARIPHILPSKFKPQPLPPSGEERGRTRAAGPPKAHSCEDLYAGPPRGSGREGGRRSASESGSECGDGLRNVSPAVRRSAADFSGLYRTMHRIERPGPARGGVRGMASRLEKTKAGEGERSEADGGGGVPRAAVSSRVNDFEVIIQRSASAPCRSSSLPTLYSGSAHSPAHSPAHLCRASAVSAESLLVAVGAPREARSPGEADGRSGGEEEESPEVRHKVRTDSSHNPEMELICSHGSPGLNQQHVAGSLSPPALHPHPHLDHQLLLKPSKCKGSCPASYTRFTTIRRHERQQASRRQERPPERKTTLPGNLFLMGPAPFRLRRNLQSQPSGRSALATKVLPGGAAPEPRPLIPRRLSSLEVLERLSNADEGPAEPLSNGRGVDANGNLLQPPAGHRRGGYLHPHPVTLSRPPVVTHVSPLSLFTLCPLLSTKRRRRPPSLVCVVCLQSDREASISLCQCAAWCSSFHWE